jgi:hypothetical protein
VVVVLASVESLGCVLVVVVLVSLEQVLRALAC